MQHPAQSTACEKHTDDYQQEFRQFINMILPDRKQFAQQKTKYTRDNDHVERFDQVCKDVPAMADMDEGIDQAEQHKRQNIIDRDQRQESICQSTT